jgi:large subunit ribosomal protein L24
MHVKKGDKVKVLSGKDKGKTGVIARAFPKEGKIVIDGVAMAKKHIRKQGNQSGHMIERPMPIDASNVSKIS